VLDAPSVNQHGATLQDIPAAGSFRTHQSLSKNDTRTTRIYAALPNLASAHEQGLADFAAPTWFVVFPPRGASEPIVRKLNQAAFATADAPSVQERLNALAAPIHRGADLNG
jgi:tripartite-type tricarboxylate transporter receptor subunit TctC